MPNHISVAFNLIFNTKDLLSTVMQAILLATQEFHSIKIFVNWTKDNSTPK